MITGVDHIDLAVSDIKAFVVFFEKMGFKVIRETEHEGEAVELQHPGENQPILELHPTKSADGTERPAGLRHIAFGVADIHEAFKAFKQNGVEVDYEPFYYDLTGRWLAAFVDPDGRKVQLVGKDAPPSTNGK